MCYYVLYIVLHHFECLILFPNHSFYLFISFSLTHFLFDILPVTKEANPTDVSKATGVKLANTHLIFLWFFFGSKWDFWCPLYKRTLWENFSFLKCWNENKVLVPWCVLLVRVHSLRKNISNLWALTEWQLMVLRQTFKDLSITTAFLRVCFCPLISNRPHFWLWSVSISVFSWSHAFPLANLYTAPLYRSIFWSAAASEQAAVCGGAAAWFCDTWQVLQLWSVFCKESLTAENAAVPQRFIAQLLPSISLTGFFLKAWGDRDVFSLTPTITILFISFSNELTLTSADSTSGVWASSSLSLGRPPPKWQIHV